MAPQLTATVLVSPVAVVLRVPAGTRVSLVPMAGDATVTLAGLDYPLDRGVLPADACLGLGNHAAGADDVRIVLHDGVTAVLVESGDVVFRPLEVHEGGRVTTSLRVWRAAAVAWAAVVLVSGLLPTQDVIEAASRGRDDAVTTAGHFAAYVLLGFLVGVALAGLGGARRETAPGAGALRGAGGAGGVVQAPLPYRGAEMTDFIVDIAGAVAGLALFSAVATVGRSRWRRG